MTILVPCVWGNEDQKCREIRMGESAQVLELQRGERGKPLHGRGERREHNKASLLLVLLPSG